MRREQLDEILRDRLVGDALEFRPRGLQPGSWPLMICFGLCAVLMAIGMFVGETDLLASVVLLPLFAFVAYSPVLALRRYTRIRRVADRWEITRRGVFRRTTREVADADVSATIQQDQYGRNEPFFVWYFHVQLAFATKAFSGAPPAINLLERYLVPLDELKALCRLFTNHVVDSRLREDRFA